MHIFKPAVITTCGAVNIPFEVTTLTVRPGWICSTLWCSNKLPPFWTNTSYTGEQIVTYVSWLKDRLLRYKTFGSEPCGCLGVLLCLKKCIVFFHSEAEGRKWAGKSGIGRNGGTAAVYRQHSTHYARDEGQGFVETLNTQSRRYKVHPLPLLPLLLCYSSGNHCHTYLHLGCSWDMPSIPIWTYCSQIQEP